MATRLFCVLVLSVSVISDTVIPFTKCKVDDEQCITKSAKEAYPLLIGGVPSLSVPSLDPLTADFIHVEISDLKYNLTDIVVQGVKQCHVEFVKIDLKSSRLAANLSCDNLVFYGDYKLGGQLILFPVKESGRFKIDCRTYNIWVDAETGQSNGDYDKTFINITNFKLVGEARGGVSFDFQNLFNRQKDVYEAIHKSAMENWKEVADLVQGPVLNKLVGVIITNINKYLSKVSVEELFL